MTTQVQPVPIQAEQLERAAQVLTRAFRENPYVCWILPNESSRERQLRAFFRVALRYGMRHAEVSTTEQTDAAALWLPPGDTNMTPMRLLRVGFGRIPFVFGARSFLRIMRATSAIDRLHHRDAPEPHWYLYTVAVDPPRQGQGIGSAMMAPYLAKADEARVPCYLETALEKNVAFFRRHRFEVVVEDTFSGGPPFWTMKRLPQG
jgi:ribosomal protein S18 acetylase RimI-like enzyme